MISFNVSEAVYHIHNTMHSDHTTGSISISFTYVIRVLVI